MQPAQKWLSIGILTALCIGGVHGCNRSSKDRGDPSLLQFASADFSGGENAGSATITVTRTGGSTGPVSVDYSTSDGSATGGVDYEAASGTLTWGGGDQADRTITIPIRDDACVESDETVNLSLSNPTGSSLLGPQQTAVLTIIEDDLLPPGSLDPGFGTGGVITVNPSNGYDSLTAVTIDAMYLYTVGWDESPGPGDFQWRIEKRLLTDGSLDPLFGTGGFVTSKPGLLDDSPWGVAVDSTFIYVTGYDESPGPGDWQWRTEKRYLSDGLPDVGFGVGGAVTSNPTPGDDSPWGLAVDSTSIYVLGYDEDTAAGDVQWRVEKLNLVDGSPDPGFGISGVLTENPSLQDDFPYALAIDSTFLYIVGDDQGAGSFDTQWRIEKRLLTDGSLDPAFGTAGVVTENPSPDVDSAWNLAIDSTHIYVVGGDMVPASGDSQWRIEKRSLADGSLEPAFGMGGVVTMNPSTGRDQPACVRVDSAFVYVCGYDESSGLANRQWRIEKMSLVDGSPDNCFGTAGAVTSDPTPEGDYAWWMAADSSHLYVVGEDRGGPMLDQQFRIEKRLK